MTIDEAIEHERKKYLVKKGKMNMEKKMEFLAKLDADTLKEELLAFLNCEDIEVDSIEDFSEQFVDYIEEDFSYGDCD